MRELKFRIWDPDRNGMFGPFDLAWFKQAAPRPADFGGVMDFQLELGLWPAQAVFLQFSGLKDKNHQEIWEGDIVRIESGAFEGTWVIDFASDAMQFVMSKEMGNTEARTIRLPADRKPREACLALMEVVGNVFENADLLK